MCAMGKEAWTQLDPVKLENIYKHWKMVLDLSSRMKAAIARSSQSGASCIGSRRRRWSASRRRRTQAMPMPRPRRLQSWRPMLNRSYLFSSFYTIK